MGRINSLAQALGIEDDEMYDETDSLSENVSDDIAEASGDVDNALSDIASTDTVTDNLVSDAETLNEVNETIDDSLDSGEGLNEETASMVQETIEGIYERHGMPLHAYPKFPSLESYDTRSQQIMATRQLKVSVEGVIDTIKEGIQKAIQATKEFFSNLWDKFKTFENRLLSGFRKLKNASKKAVTPSNDSTDIPSIVDFSSKNSVVTLSEVTGEFTSFSRIVLSQRFRKIIDDIQNGIDSDLSAWHGIEEPSDTEKNYSKSTENKENAKLDGAKLVSAFSDINTDGSDRGKASSIKYASIKEFQNACDAAIDLLSAKPLAQMKKVSDGLFTFLLKTAKEYFTSKVKKENAQKEDKGLKYTGDGQQASARDVFKRTISSYKYIMYKNINVYKETVGCYYDIIDELLSRQGVKTPDVE